MKILCVIISVCMSSSFSLLDVSSSSSSVISSSMLCSSLSCMFVQPLHSHPAPHCLSFFYNQTSLFCIQFYTLRKLRVAVIFCFTSSASQSITYLSLLFIYPWVSGNDSPWCWSSLFEFAHISFTQHALCQWRRHSAVSVGGLSIHVLLS